MNDQVSSPVRTVSIPVVAFTPSEWQAISRLHERYLADADLFDSQERAHLLFVRWLYRQGRLLP